MTYITFAQFLILHNHIKNNINKDNDKNNKTIDCFKRNLVPAPSGEFPDNLRLANSSPRVIRPGSVRPKMIICA